MNKILIDQAVQGYRGYIGSRPYSGLDFPQNVQNLLIRNYCQKNQLIYLLSATEYRMRGCYMILEEVLNSIHLIEGIVMFSIFMLPELAPRRHRLYEVVLSAGRTLHAALEDIVICSSKDIQIVEDILNLNKIALKDNCIADLRDFCNIKQDIAGSDEILIRENHTYDKCVYSE